jgi:hypothetical protein
MGEPKIRNNQIEQVEQQKTIKGRARCLPAHPATRSLNAYPSTDDENLTKNEQDGIRREFDDANSSGNPQVTVLPKVIVAAKAAPKRSPVVPNYDRMFTFLFVRKVSLLDCTCSQQAVGHPESQHA